MTKMDGNDELMELLDSFDIDDEYNALSDKMDAFTREKKKKEVVEPEVEEQPETVEEKDEDKVSEPVNVGNTIVAPLQSDSSADAGGKTMIFSKENTSAPQDGGQTVVMSEMEIKNLNSEDTEEILRRQVIEEFNNQPMIGVELKRILYIVVGTLVAFILLFGAYRLITGFMGMDNSKQADELRQEYFNEIKTWAERYDTMSEEEKEQIEDLESKFNKLTDSQKAEINQILLAKTGHTFDELLALSKSYATKEKKNNNTEVAEQKASIKAEIEELEGLMEDTRTLLDDAEEVKLQAEQDLNDAKELYENALADVQAALEELNDIEKDQLLSTEEIEKKYGSMEEFNQALQDAKTNYYDKQNNEYDFTSLSINITNATTDYNEALTAYNDIQKTYREYNQKLQDLKTQLNQLDE